MTTLVTAMEESLVRRLVYSALENNDTDILMVVKKSKRGGSLLGKEAFGKEDM